MIGICGIAKDFAHLRNTLNTSEHLAANPSGSTLGSGLDIERIYLKPSMSISTHVRTMSVKTTLASAKICEQNGNECHQRSEKELVL